jgi:hypothetical protein
MDVSSAGKANKVALIVKIIIKRNILLTVAIYPAKTA